MGLQQYKDIIVPVLKRFDIKRAAIFGSVAKGSETLESDIDLLIEPSEGFTLFSMLQLESEISRQTNRKVDIVEFQALKTSIRNEVMQSAISIL
ncbi:nucleotidyltransferase family protein [Mucilaginibacter sp. KACC 22063]|uniref:nucleotidyltransferase family protein n=1 Tax=Mucilaginibacter sp. KACC 22063 TaxID=3025666 RepID=UPI0023667D6A|nr:nucleotidyltransferase domain-containing protein [Mucilaginibacter sp. KACC 22063]WDF55342.1 nucleotidyltransferase domain-containing protein [Mucilaginibacter sp. KACC 22063]